MEFSDGCNVIACGQIRLTVFGRNSARWKENDSVLFVLVEVGDCDGYVSHVCGSIVIDVCVGIPVG